MADYRMPMDADGVKYHGTVDQNEENPGQFMYGLDENGNKRIIRTDEQGNVLTHVTGSIVEEVIFDKLEVRSTSWVTKSISNILNRYDLIIHSTLSTDLRLDVNVGSSVFNSAATRVFSTDGSTRTSFNISKGDLDNRLIIPFDQIKVRGKASINIRPSEVPTTGNLSVVLYRYE